MADTRTDSELVQACLAGNEGAWRCLVTRYDRLIFSIPRRFGLVAADAEDVAQSVFIKLYQSLDRLRETERLASWLITTAHRETWRVGRKSDRYPDLDERMGDVAAPADDEARRLEQQQLIRQALERLGGRCEQLLTLLFLKCPPVDYETIARDCGMSVGSIGATRARCLAKLEPILLELGFDPAVEFPDA